MGASLGLNAAGFGHYLTEGGGGGGGGGAGGGGVEGAVTGYNEH